MSSDFYTICVTQMTRNYWTKIWTCVRNKALNRNRVPIPTSIYRYIALYTRELCYQMENGSYEDTNHNQANTSHRTSGLG